MLICILYQVTNSDGTERIRSRRTPHQVTCKSVLLAKAECDYVGGNIAKIYDAASADMQVSFLSPGIYIYVTDDI